MNNFEKQNVQRVVNILHESTCAGLRSIKNRNDMKLCADFLDVIRTWWNINNVKSFNKDRNCRDQYSAPIRSKNDPSLEFLVKFLDYLERWNALPTGNKLTKNTFTALYTSTLVTIQAAEYFLNRI